MPEFLQDFELVQLLFFFELFENQSYLRRESVHDQLTGDRRRGNLELIYLLLFILLGLSLLQDFLLLLFQLGAEGLCAF